MSTVSRKLLTPVVSGLAVGLLAQPALAADEIVVYGRSVGVRVEQKALRADIESYIRSVNDELRMALDREAARVEAAKPNLASAVTPTRG